MWKVKKEKSYIQNTHSDKMINEVKGWPFGPVPLGEGDGPGPGLPI